MERLQNLEPCVHDPERHCAHREAARELYAGMLTIAAKCVHQGCSSKIVAYGTGDTAMWVTAFTRFNNGEIVERKEYDVK